MNIDLSIYKPGSVTSVQYWNEFVDLFVKLYATSVDPSFVSMDENARPHKAAIIHDFLEIEGIPHMEWPFYSQELNSIESKLDALGSAECWRSSPVVTLRH